LNSQRLVTGVQSTTFRLLFASPRKLKLVLYTPALKHLSSTASIDIPLLSIIQDWKLAPDLQCSFTTHELEKLRCAGPEPILPTIDVAVMNGIVMDVIDAGPKMPVRFDHPIEAVEPHLPPSLILLTIPIVGGPTVQQAKLMSEGFNIVAPDQHMVVVRQSAPGISAACKLLTRSVDQLQTWSCAHGSPRCDVHVRSRCR